MSLIPPIRPWSTWPEPVLCSHFQPGRSAARTRIPPVRVAPIVASNRAVDARDSSSPRLSRASASAIAAADATADDLYGGYGGACRAIARVVTRDHDPQLFEAVEGRLTILTRRVLRQARHAVGQRGEDGVPVRDRLVAGQADDALQRGRGRDGACQREFGRHDASL